MAESGKFEVIWWDDKLALLLISELELWDVIHTPLVHFDFCFSFTQKQTYIYSVPLHTFFYTYANTHTHTHWHTHTHTHTSMHTHWYSVHAMCVICAHRHTHSHFHAYTLIQCTYYVCDMHTHRHTHTHTHTSTLMHTHIIHRISTHTLISQLMHTHKIYSISTHTHTQSHYLTLILALWLCRHGLTIDCLGTPKTMIMLTCCVSPLEKYGSLTSSSSTSMCVFVCALLVCERERLCVCVCVCWHMSLCLKQSHHSCSLFLAGVVCVSLKEYNSGYGLYLREADAFKFV